MSESNEKSIPEAPGDKAQPGAENAGEDLCPACEGTGRYKGEECENCDGSGRIWRPVGSP